MKAADLRRLAVGMPYRSQARKEELLAWLREYRPDALPSEQREKEER